MRELIYKLTEEKEALLAKVNALNGALEKENFKDIVGDFQYGLLQQQFLYMSKYLEVLDMRIENLKTKE